MIAQTRAVLDAYRAGGGHYAEHVLADCGHSPHLEHPVRFTALVGDFLSAVDKRIDS
jgi:pimeloyl-ACP methyl ester carboxylesterase